MRRTDLPAMPLCNGCGDCCGPVSVRPDEAKRIRRFVKDNDVAWVVDNNDPLRCGFLRRAADGSAWECGVYSVRPWGCRAFGVVKEMACPHFPEAAVVSMTPARALVLRLMDPTDKFLGEVIEPGYMDRVGDQIRGLGPYDWIPNRRGDTPAAD